MSMELDAGWPHARPADNARLKSPTPIAGFDVSVAGHP
jgi:hypothetical protein